MSREQAAVWRARLAEQPELALSPEYLDWCADDDNRALADKADRAWAALDGLDAAPQMLALRQAALTDARRASGARMRWGSPQRIAAGVAAAIVLAGAGGLAVQPFLPKVYKTGVGERRVVLLADGSRLSLDAASEVRVRFSDNARSVRLTRGQARFDVTGDPGRPFLVQAADKTISASAGAFNVDVVGSELCVTPLKGKVLVLANMSPARSIAAGQQLDGAALKRANASDAVAWERGELVFADDTLSEAVARVGRYSNQRIVVDPGASGLRVSGAFNAGDTDSFLDGMTTYFGLTATPGADGSVVLRRRG
ncbi:MAG TPA: FecR domain-containing protein [Caulobacteraceae bacterium]|nr:FecR domain-containing protein [Caulobacteraceae bacterium]